jgi:hypothetical protein
MRLLALLLAGLGLAALGCGGDQSWTSDANWQGEDRSKPLTSRTLDSDDAQTLTPAAKAAQPDALTWFGVRHDLSMSPSAPRTPACGCLAVEVGMPGRQAFTWDGQVPEIGPDAVVVAISARGVDCPAEPDESKRRASISAVDRDGDDVLVEIEDLPPGRPLALGAIIPKPGPSGGLFLVAKNAKVPWVPHAAGNKRCKVKSPTAASQIPPGGATLP